MKLTRRDFLKLASGYASGLLGASIRPRLRHLSDSTSTTPNVIILVFDTFSARHVSFLGYPRLTTPNLAQFAEKATVFHRHYAAGNFTSPGTASLLTGTYPWTHRAYQQAAIIVQKLTEHNLFRLVDSSYQKAAYAQNLWGDLFLYQFKNYLDVHIKSTSFGLADYIHYNNDFWQKDPLLAFRADEDFLEQDYGIPGSLYFSFFDKFRSFLSNEFGFRDWMKEYPRGIPNFIKYKFYFVLEQVFDGIAREIMSLQKPFVGYFHFWPPHEPYCPNRRFIGMFDDSWSPAAKPTHPLALDLPQETFNQSRREYDEYIANVDAEFGQLYEGLQKEGLLENTYLIVTSDHGQMFERGVNGHVTPLLYDPLIHVPLLISTPGQSVRKDIYSPTSCVDLLPTLLKITGSPLPKGLEGDVLPGLGGEEASDRPVFAMEAKQNSAHEPITHGTMAMIQGDYKLIWYKGYRGYDDVCELYNLKADPEELHDLSKTEAETANMMKRGLQAKLALADQPFRVGD